MDAVAQRRVHSYAVDQVPLETLGSLADRIDTESATKVGSGSLGVVLVALDRPTGQQVAIKVISTKRVAECGESEARIRKEVRAMYDIDHPNLVRLIDVLYHPRRLPHIEWDPPYLCVVMDYISDSEPLSNKLRRFGRSVELANTVLPQIASALASMHEKGLVHRDVWSENVMISSSRQAILVDLGCAEYIQGESAVNSKLNIPYMSPESAGGQRQSLGDDCWALGLLVSEMVTGLFIRDRMGRSDIPLHFARPALGECKRETSRLGGQILATITSGLLELEAPRRMSMQTVLAQCRAIPQMPVANGTPKPQPQASASKASGPGGFYVGQQVTYMPRSHNIRRAAVVVGRVAGRKAWQIQLTNGVTKEVEDSDMWRISAVDAPAPPPLKPNYATATNVQAARVSSPPVAVRLQAAPSMHIGAPPGARPTAVAYPQRMAPQGASVVMPVNVVMPGVRRI